MPALQPATPLTQRQILIGYAFGACGATFFATKGILVKLAILENVDGVTTLTWRMLIATPIFIIVGLMGYRERKASNPDFQLTPILAIKCAAVGLLGYYIASMLDFIGLEYISAQFNRLILLTYPFFVVFLGAIAFGRRVTPLMVLSLFISYSGLAVIFAHDVAIDGANVQIGALLALGTAISYALYQLLAKPMIDQIGARLFTSIAMSGAGVFVVIHFFITHEPTALLVSERAMWIMLAIGTVSTVMPAYLISASISRLGPEPTAFMGNVSPLVTIVLAISILGEAFSIWHTLGSALVLAGVIVFTRSDLRARETAARKAQIPS